MKPSVRVSLFARSASEKNHAKRTIRCLRPPSHTLQTSLYILFYILVFFTSAYSQTHPSTRSYILCVFFFLLPDPNLRVYVDID